MMNMKRMMATALVLALTALMMIVPAIGETAQTAVWTSENATEAFTPDIIVPENAFQYRKELRVQLTEEQARNYQEGSAFIYVPDVATPEETAIQGICYLPLELTENHELVANFSGLYVSVDGEKETENLQAQLISTRSVLMSRQDSMDETKASLSLKGVYYGELDKMYNPFTISLDYVDNSARIDTITLEEKDRKPLDGYYSAYRFTYVLDESKDLPHYLDLESTSWTLWYENKITDPLTLRLRPVSGSGCMVLFSITNQDGTRYSLAPVRYD